MPLVALRPADVVLPPLSVSPVVSDVRRRRVPARRPGDVVETGLFAVVVGHVRDR
jgi:hypothetical protein